ncbi:MAG: glycosyltransferase family 4 protein [Pseudomonadota bacterium]|nr:glycosyltransferase family 4 protein [Pseudomonadota bacterium]
MNIVHVETGKKLYGGPRQVLLLIDGLAKKGIKNTLVCDPNSAIASVANSASTKIHCIPMLGDLDIRFGQRLLSQLMNIKPALVHIHSRRGADFWGVSAARRAKIPSILTRRVDNPELPFFGRIKYSMYNRVVAISHQIEKQLYLDGAPKDTIKVIYSAIDSKNCIPVWSREQFLKHFDLSSQNLVVLCAAQLIKRKGHSNLLNAWTQVSLACPDARLLIFGQGNQETHLKKLVYDYGLNTSVQFQGFRKDLRDFLGCADILVHPALNEGLGIILLEAQAAEVPIIAADAGGINEAVEADQTALLTLPNDPLDLASKLIILLKNESLRKSLGVKGPQIVQEKFSTEKMVNAYIQVYKEVLLD